MSMLKSLKSLFMVLNKPQLTYNGKIDNKYIVWCVQGLASESFESMNFHKIYLVNARIVKKLPSPPTTISKMPITIPNARKSLTASV